MLPLHAFIHDKEDLANLLQISHKKLDYLIKAPSFKKYTKFIIPKRSEGFRIIEAPQTSLKVVQKQLYKILMPYYSPLICVHGYVSNRSTITEASSHLSSTKEREGLKKRTRYYFKLDIEDFFPSITSRRIYGLLTGGHLRASKSVAFCISKLCVGERGLAQGSPLSPLISNMICLNMDRNILAFAKKYGLFYTRYADDIVLSTSNRKRFFEVFGKDPDNSIPDELERAIVEHNGHESFRINKKKTRRLMPDQRQLVTGIVLNEKMNVPREYYRTLRSCLHTWLTEGEEAAALKYFENSFPKERDLNSFEQSVCGKLDYYRNVVAGNKERCTSLEKLGSLFNRCCKGRKFSIHKPEDSIFNITVYPVCGDIPSEGVAFLLEGVGIVTARHIFDDFAFDGVSLKIALTSVVMDIKKKFEMEVQVSSRWKEKKYDCVKISINPQKLHEIFPFATPLRMVDFSKEQFPVVLDEELTAFDVELISDADQERRAYECVEVSVKCKKPSSPNQYGRMAQVEGAEFYKGMSGGPVINKQGEVVGIVKSGIERGSGSRCAHSKLLFLDRLDAIPFGVSPLD